MGGISISLNVIPISPMYIGDSTFPAGFNPTGLTISTDTGAGQTLIIRKAFTGAQGGIIAFAKARGTVAVPAVVVANDNLGIVQFFGYDSATYIRSAQITAGATGAIGVGVVPSFLAFQTTNAAGVLGTPLILNADLSATFAAGITIGSATLLTSSVALTNGAAANVGTLNNAPAVGNPTKWIPVNDNGTTRFIPAW